MRLLALALLFFAGPAMAEPVSIISLAASLLASGGYIEVAVAAWIAVGAAIYGTVDARRKARAAKAQARASYNASLEDRSLTILSAEAPLLVCYGRAIYGGQIVAILTSDNTGTTTFGANYTKPDEFKHIVVVVAAHEVQAINEVYIDGIACGTLDGSGYVTSGEFYSTETVAQEITIAAGGHSVQPYAVTVLAAIDTVLSSSSGTDTALVNGTYTITGGGLQINNTGANAIRVNFTYARPLPTVRIQKHLGTTSQAADAMLLAAVPSEWLSTDRLRGLAYVVVTLVLENQRFQGGPPQMTFDVTGRLVYDPRTATTAWSSNPALCARDYITSEWGMNCLSADVDDTYTNAAANACDALVQLVDFDTCALVSHFLTAANAESWTPTSATATVANGVLTLAGTGAGPALDHTGLSISGTTHRAVRVRFKRNAGSGWGGFVFYGTGGHGLSPSFNKTIAEPTYGADGYAEATWDMSALTSGGTDWTSNTITSVRLQMGATSADSFDIDWIAVGPLTGATYTCNGVVSSDQAKEAVLQDMAECMGGHIIYGAQWSIQAGAWTASVMDLTDDDLMGQIEIVQGGAGMDEVFNSVRGTYIPAGGWAAADLDVYSRASYVTADGVNLYTDLQLPFTDNKTRGKNLAALFVERNRLGQVIRYPAKLRAWPLQVGDRVRVTSVEYGFTTSYYRVTDWQFSLAGAVELTLQQDAAAIYDLPNAPTPNTAATSGLPSPWVVAAPSGLTASSSSSMADGSFNSRVRVTWTAITDPYLVDGGGFVLVRWRRVLYDPDDVWQSVAPVPAAEVYAMIEGVRVGDALMIEVRFQNGLGAFSSPSYLQHVVEDNSTLRPLPVRTNLLPNGGFENGMTGWTQVGPLTLAMIDDGVWGKRAVASSAGTTGVNAITSDFISCEDGVVYTISADAMMFATAGDVYVDLQFYNSSFVSLLDGPQNPISATIDFTADGARRQDIAVATTSPVSSAYMKARVIWDMTTACTNIGVREIKVERGDLPATAYVKNNGLVDTPQITPGAATGVYSTQASGVAVISNSHVPDGIGFRTAIATLSFTPSSTTSSNVDVLVTSISSGTIAGGGGVAAYGSYSLQNAAAFDGFNDDLTLPDGGVGGTPSGTTAYFNNTKTLRLSVPGNVPLTVGLYGKRLNGSDSFVITKVELRAEVIKK